MSDLFVRLQNAHRPQMQPAAAHRFVGSKIGHTNGRIASALIKYNRNQVNYTDKAATERLTADNQSVLNISKLHSSAREVERPKTTSYAPVKMRKNPAGTVSSPRSVGLMLSMYPLNWSRGQTVSERSKSPATSLRQKGDIEIRVEVAKSRQESQELDRTIMSIYDHILRDKNLYLNLLNTGKLLKGIRFKSIRHGSVLLTANCASLKDLSVLEERYSSGRLGQALGQTFLTKRLYSSVGYSGPGLCMSVHIDETDIEMCKTGLMTLARSLRLTGVDGGTFLSRTDCMKKITQLLNKVMSVQVSLNSDYNTFLNSLNDFFTVLKLTKPVKLSSFAELADVQRCEAYVRNSPSVGKELNTKPIEDFLQLVHYIQTEVEGISKEFKQWEPPFLKYVDLRSIELFKQSVDCIMKLLHPKVRFTDLDFTISMPMSTLERQLFGDLVKYVPALQTAIYDMDDRLRSLKNQLSMTVTSKSTECFETPKTPVIKWKRPRTTTSVSKREGNFVEKSSHSQKHRTIHIQNGSHLDRMDHTEVSSGKLHSRLPYAAVIPCGMSEDHDVQNAEEVEKDQDHLESTDDSQSSSLTSETMEQQLKVTISYKPPIEAYPKHLHKHGIFPSVTSTRHTAGNTGMHSFGPFQEHGRTGTRRKPTTDMARKLELVLSQNRKFEYESVSNIANLLPK